MLRPLYDWTLRLSAHKRAEWALAGVSFAESSFFPIPPDLMLVPMVIAKRDAAWRLATICTVASVVGGIAGYMIGYFLFEAIGRAVLDLYHLQDQFDRLAATFNAYGAEILILKGMTPIPYKLLTITAGATHLSLGVFIGASVISRSIRFFLVAGLLHRFGEPVRAFIEKRLTLVTSAVALAVIGGFLALKLL